MLGLGAIALLACGSPALAQSASLPTGGAFTAGAGTIHASGDTMAIAQSSQRGVIDWQDFSIGADHQVLIDNAAGATLNRVMSGQLSRLDGRLTATGSVYLMNPTGVIIGPNGVVSTGGDFVASTRQIDPAQFMGGGALTVAGGSNGGITNQGSVMSQAGGVIMIAREVTNRGTIQAAQGRVTLAAANEVLLATTDGTADRLYVAAGIGGGDITQEGRIEAAAVALQAANGNIFALAGNREGLIQATGTATIDGELWLTAPGGAVGVSGSLRAAEADGRGGRVAINGRNLSIAGQANISAAGTAGGEVVIGAAGFGTGTELAERTVISDGARISAGGPAGGGRIETSGRVFDLGAATVLPGAGGTWLIDPDDLMIDAPAAAGIVTSLNAGGGTVLVQTTAGGTGGVGDITVAAPIVWTEPTGSLAIDAYRNIAINAEISGAGDITLTALGTLDVSAAVSGRLTFAQIAGAVTVSPGGALSGTDNVAVEAGNFVNLAGGGALSSSGGNWFLTSDDAAGSDDGGLVPDYYAYDYANVTAFPAPGNGRFYREAPSASFTLGPVVKDYDGTTVAVLDSSNVTVTGLVNGDAFTLDGSYATKDAGTGIDVTATNFEANRGGIPVFNYVVATPSVTAAVGTINRKTLTALIVGTPTKTYNATTDVSLTAANFQLLGVVSGESITVNAAATAAYAAPDAGPRQVNASFTTPNFSPGSGTLLTNYVLPTSATGLGLIDQASLILSGLTADDKVYDSTTAAVLNTANLSIFGAVAGDSVGVDTSAATGTFASEDVGNAIAVAATGFVLTGADAANYTVDQPGGLAANITPAALLVSGLVANDKIYDGTTTASLNAAGVLFTGLISGDDVAADGTGAEIHFATKNAGQDIAVTISGMTLSGSDAGNYSLSYSGSLDADIFHRVLTFGFSGTPTKVYDGSTSAVVGSAGASLGNVVAGESISITQAADIQYASKNVGVWTIDGTLTPADFQAGPGTLLSNYVLPVNVSTTGEITPAPLTISITGNPTKAYDGNPSASLGPSNFAVSGFVAGEGATVTETSGSYASSDAGVWTVSADLDAGDFDPNANTMMSNYIIPSPVTGPGTITRIPLGPGAVTVDITGNPSKVYDGTTVATLTPGDYTLGGFLAGEGATITETVGEYDLKDAGLRAVLVLLDPGDFAPDPGTNLDNYVLPTEATGIGTIFQKTLSAAIIGNPTKIYNGTVRAAAGPANYSVDGVIAGESVTVATSVVANYGSEDAGLRVVTANFTADSNFVFGSGTLRANYVLPTIAQGPGTITPAPLVVLGVSAQNKVYDQTTLAALSGAASLFGVIAGDTVTLDGGSATGAFATPNVGTGIAVTVSGYGISGPDSANYELFQPSGLAANITPLGLSIAGISAQDKIYDGTTVATLSGGTLTGVLAGDDVTLDPGGAAAAFLQKNVGTDLRVNVSGFALSGAGAGNYSIAQPANLTADIFVRPLVGSVTGNPTKTYDGTTTANLTAANYALTGFVAGEGGAITQSSAANYASADAGSWTIETDLVVSDFTANPGTLLSNYLLPTSISGSGTINQAQLIVSIIGNPTKVYDATTTAALTSANYLLQGFVAGEGATVTETSGTYDQKNVGGRTVTAVLAGSDFAADSGTTMSNYVLPTMASGAGTITPAALQVINITAADKEYDGNTTASLSGGALDNVLGTDVVTLVTSGATGQFADKNVGVDKDVTATGYTISGADAGNYTLAQPDAVLADIFAKAISLASVTKVYDAGRAVPTVGSAYTLNGVVSGDTVSVDASGIVNGFYDDKNVDTGKIVNIQSGVALTGADAGNYLIDDFVTNAAIGIITPATLTVQGVTATNRQYDQTVIVAVSGGTLGGVLTDQDTSVLDDVSFILPTPTSGTMQDANVGIAKPVTVTGFAIQGADSGNYTLQQPDDVTVTITPAPITLIRVEKIYDGTAALPTASSGYGYTGIFAGDNVTTSSAGATGGYLTEDAAGSVLPDGSVASGILVNASGLTLGGPQGLNYTVSPVVSQPIGVITPKQLTVAIVGNPSKVYDGNAAIATLTNANFDFEGFVLSESVTVNQQNGTFNSLNVDEATTITASLSGPGDISWDNALASNYLVPAAASGVGTITPAQLTIDNVVALDKIYDGNTVATLDNVNGPGGPAELVGLVAADIGTVTLNTAGAAGAFASPNVGTWGVTASGYALDGNVHGNYSLVQPQGLSASITAAQLTLIDVFRVYDGSLILPTVSSGYTLSGLVAGDDVTVDATAASATGSYASSNVATGILVTIPNLQLSGADAGNYSVSLPDPAIGRITPKDLAVVITGDPSKVYNGLATINTLTPANFLITGLVAGEQATISQNLGSFNSPDVLAANTITASIGGFVIGVPLTGFDINNYTLPATAQGAGTVTPAAVTIAIVGAPSKVYDGNVSAALTTSNYAFTGFIPGQGAEVSQTAGTYNSKDVLAATTITADIDGYITGTGSTLLSNYALPTEASGGGTITPALLTAAIIGNPTKVYDGNTDASLDAGDYQFTGFVAGEGASVSQTLGTYNSRNVVTANTVTADIDGFVVADSGTLLSNYTVPVEASGAGTITQAALTAAIIGSPTKVYDGDTTAALTAANYQLSGFVGGEGATVSQTAGVYNSKDVVSATTVTADIDGFIAGTGATLLSNYALPTQASGAGAVTQAQLMAAIIGNPTKVYDGDTDAALSDANFALTGFIGGEGATVSQTLGSYNTKDVLTADTVTAVITGFVVADSGTLLSNYALPTDASGAGAITAAPLTASIVGLPTKDYDATTGAALTSANFELEGFVAGESATVTQTQGLYGSPNAGIRAVSAQLAGTDFAAVSGTDLTNYILPASAAGFGIIERLQLTAAIVNNPRKSYDGTTAATLAPANYQLSGFVAGQGATVTETSGEYDLADAGSRTVTATLGSPDFIAEGGTSLLNYILPTSATGAGTIDPALLSVAIIGNPTRVYDGTTAAALTSANYQFTGFIGSDGATVSQTAGLYNSKDVVTATTVSADIAGLIAGTGSTQLSNYVLPTDAIGPGAITTAALAAIIVGNPTRPYDGTTAAALTPANYSLTGFVGGEGATVNQTAGIYGSKDAGSRIVTATLSQANFDASGVTLLSNYALPSSASGLGTITQAQLTAAIIGNPDKVYDGDADAALTSANYALTGFAPGEGGTVSQAAGTYNSKDVLAATTVTADIAGFIAPNAGTALSNYVLPSEAMGPGTISAALLAAAIVGNPTKVYDGTTDATLGAGNFELTGFVAGEGASVTQTAGTYGLKDAGLRIVTASLGSGDFAATGATLLSNYVLPVEARGLGTINQAPLLVAIVGNPSKTYDGDANAALVPANFAFTGLVAGEGAAVSQTSGTYNSKDVLAANTVTADIAGFVTGTSSTLLSNYLLPTQASGVGTITPTLLAAAIIGDPTKIYDGNADAELAPANFALTGFIAGEGATVTEEEGLYDSANAGARTVTAQLAADEFAAEAGTLLSNYVLPTEAVGMGTILARPISARVGAAIVNNPTKVYDGTTIAVLTPGNFALEGFVGTDGATVTQTLGQYADKNAGVHLVTSQLSLADFLPDPGTVLDNYLMPEVAVGPGTITQAMLTAAIIGNPSKIYDGNAIAALTSGNYQLSGFVAGEGASVTQGLGTYNSKDVLTATTVTADIDGFILADAGTFLSNYALPVQASGAGSITPAAVSAAIIGTPTKIFDDTVEAQLSAANFSLTGFVAGEGATVGQTLAAYNSANVVEASTVTAALDPALHFTANGGTLLSNYLLPVSATGAGAIDPKAVGLVNSAIISKAYDGTANAEVEAGEIEVVGLVGDDTVSVEGTIAGAYPDTAVGRYQLSITPVNARLVAAPGTLLSNYVLQTGVIAVGEITPAPLTVALRDVVKSYDGTNLATLLPANFQLSGFAAGEGAVITQSSGLFASPNAGQWSVTAMLAQADYTANAGTALSNYSLPTIATGLGTINPLLLTAWIIGNPTKVYDGNASATLTSANFLLSGFIAGQGASVTQTQGSYNSKNVVEASTVTASLDPGASFTANSGTLLGNYILPTTATGPGIITPAPLDVTITGNPTKFYDGNTDAVLEPEDYTISGFISGEGATITASDGSYSSPDAGQHPVTVPLGLEDFVPENGTLISNYSIPDSATGPGTIERVIPCEPDILACLPDPGVLANFQATQPIHFYIVFPTTFARYQGHTSSFAALPSVLVPTSITLTDDGWLAVIGANVVNSSEQILQRGGGSTEARLRYTPPEPKIELESELP